MIPTYSDRFEAAALGAVDLINSLPDTFRAVTLLEQGLHEQKDCSEREARKILNLDATNEGWMNGPDYPEWSKRADRYIENLLANYPEEPTPGMLDAIWNFKFGIDPSQAEDLRKIDAGLVPIVMIRYLVYTWAAPLLIGRHLQHHQPHYVKFADRYRPYIMA